MAKMIDKISAFFTSQKRKIPLFFDQNKKYTISIEITPEKTISEIYLENINQISAIKAKISQKKDLSNNNCCFTLFSKEDPYIRILLNNDTILWAKFNNNEIIAKYSLFYTINDKFYSFMINNLVSRRLNSLNNNNRNFSEYNYSKNISKGTRLINFVSADNTIIYNEIEKYSFSKNQFINISLCIDSNKLMYRYQISNNHKNQNLWNVTPLSAISSIDINLEETDLSYINIDVNKIKDKIFIIKTYNNEKIIFKANNKSFREKCFNDMKTAIEFVRINELFIDYKEVMKNIYLIKLKFVFKLFGIKGTLMFKNSRKFFFENFVNEDIKKIIELCLEYKLNVLEKNNYKALEQIKKLVEFFGSENFQRDKKFHRRHNEESKENNLEYINKSYILNHFLDDESFLKIYNIYHLQRIKNRTSSLIILDINLVNHLMQNLFNKFLIKEHKKMIQVKKKSFLESLTLIPAAQSCKINCFNSNKMQVLFQDNMNINIPPDKIPDLNILL